MQRAHAVIVLQSMLVLCTAGESPEALFEDMLTKEAVYGECWPAALDLVRESCSKPCLTTDTEAKAVLAMYNCFLKRFEDRKLDCGNSKKVIKCADVQTELTDPQHRLLFAEFRSLRKIFCQQLEPPDQRVEMTSTADAAEEGCTFRAFPTSDMRSALKYVEYFGFMIPKNFPTIPELPNLRLQQNFRSFSLTLGRLLRPLPIYCWKALYDSIHQFFSLVWISSSQWKSMAQIVVTDLDECGTRVQPLRNSILADFAHINSWFFHLAIFCLLRSYWNNWPHPNRLKEFVPILAVGLSYLYEKKVILYAIKECPGVGESLVEAAAFLRIQQFASRILLLVVILIKFIADSIGYWKSVWERERKQ